MHIHDYCLPTFIKTVNDAFVAGAWAEAQNCNGKVRILADHNAELTRALGVEFDLTSKFGIGGIRCKRFSALVENGTVTIMKVEPDGGGLTCSLAPNLLSSL